ncbi:unnamed protein product [Adineta steineri]|uniref:NAD(P)(+)--arginine ADP-ribosyltransferase n=2 Tax=Adineta steineri TaxID=433720 RepID=A0A819TXM7_9BILA|nr:unnamed protein product [Adineta steineri]
MSESKSNQNATTLSKSTASSNIRQPQQRMAQSCLVLCVDTGIKQTNQDCFDTLFQLKNMVDDVNLCTTPDQCIQILNQVDYERAFIIASGSLGEHLVPKIHGMSQLDAIYILHDNKCRYEGWTQNWTKIKGVHTNINEICEALQLAVKECDQDSTAVSFLTVPKMASTKNLNELEPTFMYTQVFKEILLDMQHDEQAIRQFIAYCRNNNSLSPINIDRFEKKYHAQSAIWWYSSCNIYFMLNNALRTLDADAIITMGFFMSHLHQQIQQLYEQQVNSYGRKPFIVYRGQGLLKSDFEKLQKTKGGLMSFNNFLSTSKDKQVSLQFARRASRKPDMVGIIFIMSIDPCLKSTPFASIKEKSPYKKQEEILFSMHTVFRVGAVKQINNENQLYQVELQLTSDDDQQLRLLTNRIREEVGGTGWQRLGSLLLKIGQINKAEELYNILLEQTSDESEKALYYNQLGYIKDDQGDYEKAICYFEQGLEIQQRTLPSNHSELANSYNNIGSVYNKMGEYSKAPLYYERALEILKKALPSNHLLLAILYNNIGSVHNSMGEYSKALSYYEKALEIWGKSLPSNHPSLATLHNSIGNVYNHMGEYLKALSSYEKALDIRQKSLSSNHTDLATSYGNIGLVYCNMGKYSKALSFNEKALDIQQKNLPSNHPDLASTYNNIGMVHHNMEECSKALSFYEKAVKIQQRTLPSNHPHLATTYNNIGSVCDKMGEYSKALSSHEKAHEIRQKTLPSNHPDLAQSYNNIAKLNYNMKDYSKALSCFERALDILRSALPPSHPHIKSVKESIEIVKKTIKISCGAGHSNNTIIIVLFCFFLLVLMWMYV